MTELPQISVSVKAAVLRQGRILLLSYHDRSGFHYNLPGGKAKKGEGLRNAVCRKVTEETGLRVRPLRLLFTVEYVPQAWAGEFGDVQKVQFNFLAAPLDDAEPRLCEPPDPNQVGFDWAPIADLENRYLLPRVAAPLMAALAEDRPDVLVDQW
jgi:8-oxo-dGTP diphosphatase